MTRLAHHAMLVLMLFYGFCGSCWGHRHECSCGEATPCPPGSLAHEEVSVEEADEIAFHGSHRGCTHSHAEHGLKSESTDTTPAPVHHSRCVEGQVVFLNPQSVIHPMLWDCGLAIEAHAGMNVTRNARLSHWQDEGDSTRWFTSGERCALFQVWRI